MAIPPAPDLKEINYELPDHRIAKYPLEERDQSNILVYDQGKIEDKIFHQLPDTLGGSYNLFFNNTKVIPARLNFQKETGAQIEIFLLNPVAPSPIISLMMEEKGPVIWECMVGNFRKWKDEQILTRSFKTSEGTVEITAKIIHREEKRIEFEWSDSSISFAEIVEMCGSVPLPPYLNREAETEDKERYQTVYSKQEGAVAAPTAGLHFTDKVLMALESKGIQLNYLTLHVSAGTFQPIKATDAREHNMHSEQVEVKRNTIELLARDEQCIAVGTTSMRTLESLYWFGIRLMKGNAEFAIQKLEPYRHEQDLPGRKDVFSHMLEWMDSKRIDIISGKTEIFIIPGYDFKVCDGLITNFHQPGSTLMLLVWAFIGDDWKKVYQHALNNEYRFLSYGDSSLLLPEAVKK